MIKEEKINGLLFQEQRTYYIYASEEDRSNGKYIACMSDQDKFEANKKLAKEKELAGDADNKFIVF